MQVHLAKRLFSLVGAKTHHWLNREDLVSTHASAFDNAAATLASLEENEHWASPRCYQRQETRLI